MNSIILTHVASPDDSQLLLEAALERLGAWLDDERDTLGRIFAQCGRRHAAAALEWLDQLHLEPSCDEAALRDLLDEARATLNFLCDILCTIPSYCRLETAWGFPGPAPLHQHLGWSAARLVDLISTLDRALAS